MLDICIKHFRLSINSSRSHALDYSDRTSRLFHHDLKTLLERVLSGTIPDGVSIRLESSLVLKLGDIPSAFFERIFCQRLESALEQAIRKLLSEQADLWTRDSPEQCRMLLEQALSSGDEPVDTWLARQLELAPEIWLPVLAEYVLLPEGIVLYHQLREASLRDVCHQLAPDIPQQEGVTGDSLWLSALYYFQQHPTLPVPSVPTTVVPGVPPELRVGASAERMHRYDARLVQAFFEHAVSPRAHLIPWLRAIWQNPVVVDSVHQLFPSERKAQLQRQLASNSQSPQQTQPSHPGSRKSDSLPDEHWQPVSCAGMVLLWPVLPGLFRHLGLVEGRQFVSQRAQRCAAGCLLWLAFRQGELPPETIVSQLLCGLSPEGEMAPSYMPDGVTQARLEQWMAGLPALLPSTWQKLSVEDIRQWFLLRPGWMSPDPGQRRLRIQPEAFDVLLNDWPWPANMVPLPWLAQPLSVYWNDN